MKEKNIGGTLDALFAELGETKEVRALTEEKAARRPLPKPFRVRVHEGHVVFRTRSFGFGEALLVPIRSDDELVEEYWERRIEEAESSEGVDFDEFIAQLEAEVGEPPESEPPPKISEFDLWVGANNIPETYAYTKGWWDYVELVRRFAYKCAAEDVRVVGHYVIDTPPPRERLPMPAVALVRPGVTVALRWDFASFDRPWTVSVRRRSPYRGPLFGLFDSSVDVREGDVSGLSPGHVFGPYRSDAAAFSCKLEDEFDVSTLLRLVCHEV